MTYYKDKPTSNKHINNLAEENNILFEQLNIVQSELENYNYRFSRIDNLDIPSEARDALVENIKLQALVKQQKIALKVEHSNSLASRLGEILIKGVSSPSSFLALPIKLCKIWKAQEKNTPPAALGGKTFQKILDTYTKSGLEAVEKLLDSIYISQTMRANVYTALARYVMHSDAKQTAIFARQAWETDPRPYRLKWLAFRLHEAGDVITAEAILEMLPTDITMTQSEIRHAERIKDASKIERYNIAQRIINSFNEKKRYAQENFTNSAKKTKKQLDETLLELENLRSEHKKEISFLNMQLAEQKKAVEQAQQDATHSKELHLSLLQKMEIQKKESDALALQTSIILKKILTEFEPNTETLITKLLRIIMNKK